MKVEVEVPAEEMMILHWLGDMQEKNRNVYQSIDYQEKAHKQATGESIQVRPLVDRVARKYENLSQCFWYLNQGWKND